VSAFLYRLGRNSARHPFVVIGVWLVAAACILGLQGAAGGKFDNSERVPGVESQHAADVLNARFPSEGGQSARIVLHTDTGQLDDAGHRPTVEQVRAELAGGTPSPASPTRSGSRRPRSAPTAGPVTSTSHTRSTSSRPPNSMTPPPSRNAPAPAECRSSSTASSRSSSRSHRAAS